MTYFPDNRHDKIGWATGAPLSSLFFMRGNGSGRKSCDDQLHALRLAGVNSPAFSGVDTSGVDAAMPQNIRQTGQVSLQRVVRPGEQVAQVVGKHLSRLHPSTITKSFHTECGG